MLEYNNDRQQTNSQLHNTTAKITMKLSTSASVLVAAHQAAAALVEIKAGVLPTQTTLIEVSCPTVISSLVAAAPTPGRDLGWGLELAWVDGDTDASHCTVTLPGSLTAEYASLVTAHAAWWNNLPSAAASIHDLCGKPRMTLMAIPTWLPCRESQTVVNKENTADRTVLPKGETPIEIRLTALRTSRGTCMRRCMKPPRSNTMRNADTDCEYFARHCVGVTRDIVGEQQHSSHDNGGAVHDDEYLPEGQPLCDKNTFCRF